MQYYALPFVICQSDFKEEKEIDIAILITKKENTWRCKNSNKEIANSISNNNKKKQPLLTCSNDKKETALVNERIFIS